MPAFFVELAGCAGGPGLIDETRVARRFVLQADVDAEGRISRLYSVLATRELTHAA